MSALQNSHLEQAVARIGGDPETRRALIDIIGDWEQRHARQGEELRETTSGYLVDAMHADADTVTRSLHLPPIGPSGAPRELSFTMLYRSKMGREFAMATGPLDHAWEPQTTRLLRMLAAESSTALIGGAYSGDHAVPMMMEMRDAGGKCYCFEPNLEQAALLRRNADANGLRNYALSNDGLWSETAELVMVGADSHAHPEVYTGQAGDRFQAVSIDDFCAAQSIEILDIIMLDIEGGEIEALKGAVGFLSAPRAEAPEIIFEIHRSYVDWTDGLASTPICSLLLDHGYTLYGIRDYQANVSMAGAPIEVVPLDSCYVDGPPHGFNIFASKREDCIDRLGLQVCENVSPKLLTHRDPALHQPMTR